MALRIVILLLSLVAVMAVASDHRHAHGNHHQHQHGEMKQHMSYPAPKEAGQGAFAALAEIVSLLENDPNTDWATVNIDALREHLVDMNQLTLNANVSKQVEAERIIFTVTGTGPTLRAIQNMVPAHSAQLAQTTPWQTKTEKIAGGVRFSLSSDDDKEMQKIAALGFFGVMAVGSHHQVHHLQMAKGMGHP